ncbi:MAG: phosphoribosylglycinamide synthetase C domain-containing protein, partial [Chloroflexota bacterium]
GPVLLECNARFGDPEAQVLFPRIATPLGPVLLAAARGTLAETVAQMGIQGPVLPTFPGATVGVVLAATGYPDAPRRGDTISGLGETTGAGHLVFHAGTASGDDGGYVTNGGRIVTVVTRGRDLVEAAERADAAASLVRFHGSQRRRDIGRGAMVLRSDRDAPDRATAPTPAGARG